jgi:hypothetical protein
MGFPKALRRFLSLLSLIRRNSEMPAWTGQVVGQDAGDGSFQNGDI